jgi:4,5-dihydroxyphthalate decarboxylase
MNRPSRRQFFETAGAVAGASLIHPGRLRSAPRGEAPKLTLTFTEYLRFTPLATGNVRPTQMDLTWVRGARTDMLSRTLGDPAVDGGEASMLAHLLRLDAGDRSLAAVPVFLLRNFTARDLYTRKGSPVTPTSLNGRRMGIYNWAASGAVWYRHLLRYFGQDPASMTWVVGGTDQPAKVDSRAPLPPHVTNAPPDKSLTDLLLAGDLDAIFVPLPPAKYDAVKGPIVRLVPDFRAVEQRYFAKTRCYPPQHVLLVRKQTWDRVPGVGRQLVEIFDQCEARFLSDQRLYPYASPWEIAELEETDRVMGLDYHAHGLERNRHAIDVFCQSAFDDGLTKRRMTVEDYFAEFLKS